MAILVFTFSMFLSAALLFVVEPMIAKMVLPLLGGTPAVWNTCLVFFQAVLLAGYLYAHASLKWLGRRTQIAAHLVLVLLPLLVVGLLPPHLPPGWEPPTQSNPTGWILALLLIVVGLPFFALSATTSIMQRWFAESGHKDAADPYFLYAASNTGSVAGLLAYPFLMEPLLRLSTQSRLWSAGYTLFIVMTAVCALLAWSWRRPAGSPAAEKAAQNPDEQCIAAPADPWMTRLRWIALAFVPSSLMLGVTTAMTADVPPIPLFWVLPLALYLVSFVLVFARRPPIPHQWMVDHLPFVILCGICPTVSQTRFSLIILLLVYLLVLFSVAMVCHGELARSRPQVSRLTEFYLWISVGGVLGGAFNSLLAPRIFHSVMELPLVLIFASLLRPPSGAAPLSGKAAAWARRKDWLLPLALGLCMLAVILGLARAGIEPGHVETTLVFGYSLLWCLSFGKRRMRFALGLTAVLIASWSYAPYGRVLAARRSFFGVYRVMDSANGRFRYLFHGGIVHGIQSRDPAHSREPLAYYARSGPGGAIFQAAQARMPHGNWAIVGLGAGAMACYLQPGQTLTFYEIDPLVVQIARDPRFFTFLEQCAPQAGIVLGDARLQIRNAPDAYYGLIVLDAFNGDSIPMHLMTREALALYLRKLAPGGILAFHISNLYFRLAPTLGDLAADAHLACMLGDDTQITQAQSDAGESPSIWLVMARNPADLDGLSGSRGALFQWVNVQGRPRARVWTDDYSNLLSVVKSFVKVK
ncbi:MAG: fused MFS/spermidine synthase [Terracidiphilus sp.]